MLDSLRNRGFAVSAIEKFGHDPKYPVTDNWPHLVQQLADFAQAAADRAGQPVFLVGHSLGGFLSLMCAARHPALACGVVLLDSPILGGWRANTLNLVKRTPLMKSVSPGLVSRKRRNSWTDREAVFEHFRSKKVFEKWDEQVLHDYIDHGTFNSDDMSTPLPDVVPGKTIGASRTLSFDRDVETAIYDTLPHNLSALLRRHPLEVLQRDALGALGLVVLAEGAGEVAGLGEHEVDDRRQRAQHRKLQARLDLVDQHVDQLLRRVIHPSPVSPAPGPRSAT